MFKSQNDVELCNQLLDQISKMAAEMQALSKKSPDGAINKFKLSLINKLIERSNYFLNPDYMPFDDFVMFEDSDLPSNSDVLIVLRQYHSCLSRFKDAGTGWDPSGRYTIVKGDKVYDE